MSAVHHFLLAAALLAGLTGGLFLAGTGYYLSAYLGAETPIAARDHWVGVGVGLRYTFGAFAVAAVLALPVRRALPPALVRLLMAPAAVSGAGLLGWLVLGAAGGPR